MNAAKLKTMYMLILYRLSFWDLELNMNKAWNHLISRVAHKLWFTPDNNFFLFPFFWGGVGATFFKFIMKIMAEKGNKPRFRPRHQKI